MTWTLEGVKDAIYRFFPQAKAYSGTIETPYEIKTTGVEVVPNVDLNLGFPAGNRNDTNSSSKLYFSIANQTKTKQAYNESVNSIKDYHLAEGIINNIANDVLHKYYDKKTRSRFFEVSIKNNKDYKIDIKKLTNDLDNFNIELMLTDYIFEILWYGEYYFKIDYENNDLDDVEQDETFSLFIRGRLKYIIKNLKVFDSKDYMIFKLFPTSNKLLFKDDAQASYFVRMSRGVFSSAAINLMTTLRLMEALIPVNQIDALSKKMQFYMRVPNGTSPKEAYDKARRYELLLLGLLKSEVPTTVEGLLNEASKVKVVPLFGEQQELTSLNLDKTEKIDLTFINDLREQLINTTSIPKSFIFPESVDGNNSKYLRLLSAIRNALAEGPRHLAYELITKQYGKKIDFKDIEVTTPSIQGLEDLDAIEYNTIFNQTISDINKIVQDVSDTLDRVKDSKYVKVEPLVDFYNAKLAPLTNSVDLLQKPPKEEPNITNVGDEPGEQPDETPADADVPTDKLTKDTLPSTLFDKSV